MTPSTCARALTGTPPGRNSTGALPVKATIVLSMPTSLMPFYGQTPDEAARELSKRLSLVSAPVAANT